LFLEFRLDGLRHPLKLSPRSPSAKLRWEIPARLILNLRDLGRAFVFVCLGTADAPGGRRSNIGRAKFPLKSLPVGDPKSFKFCLMSSANSAISVATVHVTACLSALVGHECTSEVGVSGGVTGRSGQYWSAPSQSGSGYVAA
jgi:hypothetical protein